MLTFVISWLDSSRGHFWLVAALGTLLWAWLTFRNWRDRRPSWGLWSLGTIVLLLAWRWPYLVGPAILNPDEAQMLAEAITLKSHPLFWKYVDGTTHGPVADLPLLLAHVFGLRLDYATARFVSGLLMLGGFILLGRALMLVCAPIAVRLGLAPIMLLWAIISYYDFTGYTSEQASIFLILASVWPLLSALVRGDLPAKKRVVRLAFGGVLLGCVPYAKLQGTPPALAIGLSALVSLCVANSSSIHRRCVLAVSLIIGALIPTILLGAYLWIWSLGGQFRVSYIESNLAYHDTGTATWPQMLSSFWKFMAIAPGLQTVAAIVATFAALAILLRICSPKLTHQSLAERWTFTPSRSQNYLTSSAILIITAVSVYACLGAHRMFGHYLQYLSIPLGFAGIASIDAILRRLQEFPKLRHLFPLVAVASLGLAIWATARRSDPEMFGLWTKNRGEWRQPASIAIARVAHRGDTMSVWGWMPSFYVETGLPQATREAHTYHEITPQPLRDFYRSRYLRDFRRHPPRIFVDAVGGDNFSYKTADRPNCAHESFPGLAVLIARDYSFIAEVAGSRIYIRK